MWEVVGRLGRQVKLYGLRLDLDHLERRVAATAEVRCVVADDVLHAFTTRTRVADRLREDLARAVGVPATAVRVTTLAELPLTESGKHDLAALREHAALLVDEASSGASVRDDYRRRARASRRDPDDTFVSLGGDSLSYVELATRLTDRLGELPTDWHTRAIGSLAAPATTRPGTRLDTSVVLRAAAILAIVGTHANVWTVVGGAHLLLAVAGWNFARFQLTAATRTARLRHGVTSLAQVVLPASLWVGGVALATGYYSGLPVAYLNGFLGPQEWDPDWQFWFLEALVWFTVAVLALLAVPAVDRLERRAPYRFALGVLLVALAFRFWWVGIEAGPTNRYTIGLAAGFLALGWLGSRADTAFRRWSVVGLAAVATYGFFGDLSREALVVAGIALLVLVPTMRVPRRLVATTSVLASSSLFVYVTHWQVYPHLEDSFPLLATALSFAVGIGYWWVSRPVLRALGRRLLG